MSPIGPDVKIPGISDKGSVNGFMRPVDNAMFPVPWATHGSLTTAEVLCETFWIDGRAQAACPRYVARKQLEQLSAMGYELFSGFECEFLVSRLDNGERLFQDNGIYTTQAFAENEAYLYSLESQLRQSGIDIEGLHCEFSNGQFEFITHTECGLRSADNVFRLKQAVKEISFKHGYAATFMSKPFSGENGSGLHFNHSLRARATKGDDNTRFVFYDAAKPDNMSDVFRWWLGGLLKHGMALTALCSPTVNCYRRLHQPWAPSLLNWGIDNRMTSFRVKNHSPGGSFIENRLGAGSANPYIVMAATVAAGIDGIKNQIDCASYHISKPQPPLPHTLAEALSALYADKIIVESLGEEFITWIKLLRDQIDFQKLKDSDIADTGDAAGFENERNLYMRYM